MLQLELKVPFTFFSCPFITPKFPLIIGLLVREEEILMLQYLL